MYVCMYVAPRGGNVSLAEGTHVSYVPGGGLKAGKKQDCG